MNDPIEQSPAAREGVETRSGNSSGTPNSSNGLQRMNRLLAAQLSVGADLDLPRVLTRITEAAVELVGARYGALGVLAPDGSLEDFAHVGVDQETTDRIGSKPHGRGLLVALTQSLEPIRLTDLASDPRSVGFPDHHPPMKSFLGVPIRLREEIFGNLYLCDREDGQPFSDDDEMLAKALAASAGVAIENARLYQRSRHRERWAEGSAQVVEELIEPGADPLQLVADRVRDLADADLVSLLLPAEGGLKASRTSGPASEQVAVTPLLPEDSLPFEAMRSGRPQLTDDWSDGSRHEEPSPYGPEMAVPMMGSDGAHGVLVVARYRDKPRFTETDLDVAASFAAHATVALEFGQAHVDRERMLVLEDRERIARDLHDHVIQRLFATGITLQSLTSGAGSPETRSAMLRQIDEIDRTIRQVRNTIFELKPVAGRGKLRTEVLQTVRAATRLFATPPQVRFSGPVDTLTPPAMNADIVAVVREGLSNAARHAEASWVEVELVACADGIRIDVRDNGVGIAADPSPELSGLSNLQARAERLGGTFTLAPRDPNGTVLSWAVPWEGGGSSAAGS